jgi:hypothetical protein
MYLEMKMQEMYKKRATGEVQVSYRLAMGKQQGFNRQTTGNILGIYRESTGGNRESINQV